MSSDLNYINVDVFDPRWNCHISFPNVSESLVAGYDFRSDNTEVVDALLKAIHDPTVPLNDVTLHEQLDSITTNISVETVDEILKFVRHPNFLPGAVSFRFYGDIELHCVPQRLGVSEHRSRPRADCRPAVNTDVFRLILDYLEAMYEERKFNWPLVREFHECFYNLSLVYREWTPLCQQRLAANLIIGGHYRERRVLKDILKSNIYFNSVKCLELHDLTKSEFDAIIPRVLAVRELAVAYDACQHAIPFNFIPYSVTLPLIESLTLDVGTTFWFTGGLHQLCCVLGTMSNLKRLLLHGRPAVAAVEEVLGLIDPNDLRDDWWDFESSMRQTQQTYRRGFANRFEGAAHSLPDGLPSPLFLDVLNIKGFCDRGGDTSCFPPPIDAFTWLFNNVRPTRLLLHSCFVRHVVSYRRQPIELARAHIGDALAELAPTLRYLTILGFSHNSPNRRNPCLADCPHEITTLITRSTQLERLGMVEFRCDPAQLARFVFPNVREVCIWNYPTSVDWEAPFDEALSDAVLSAEPRVDGADVSVGANAGVDSLALRKLVLNVRKYTPEFLAMDPEPTLRYKGMPLTRKACLARGIFFQDAVQRW